MEHYKMLSFNHVVAGFRCQESKKRLKTATCLSEAAEGETACRAEAFEAKAGTLKPPQTLAIFTGKAI
jgi:hypothetical protein